MNLLAIETATEMCSAALLHNGQITLRSQRAPQQHAALILDFIEALLQQQALKRGDIDGVVYGHGPGAFTGVRIATSVAQGLSLGLGVPALGVSSLAALALNIHRSAGAPEQARILAANDARMGEVYWAVFDWRNGALHRHSEDAVDAPDVVPVTADALCGGTAFKAHPQLLQTHKAPRVFDDLCPQADALLTLAVDTFHEHAGSAEQIAPQYVREKVVFS